jgi:hypothetical protein
MNTTNQAFTFRVSNGRIAGRFKTIQELVEKELKEIHPDMRRSVGYQVVLDFLMDVFHNEAGGVAHLQEMLKTWESDVVGYPFSARKNPGQWTTAEEQNGE